MNCEGMRVKRIIVSGASGFLGSNIINKALHDGIDVVAITSKEMNRSDLISVKTDEFLEKGCLLNSDDVFVNCLFPTNADGYKMAGGLEKVYRMISTARISGVGAFINISSQSVYASKRTTAAKESDMLSLESPYAVGKFSSEAFTNQVFGDLPHTNIRMASLLGVGYDQRIVNRMIDQALEGKPLKVIGGMQRYGFLDVRDAAVGLIKLAMSNPDNWKEVYNLGRNESYSLIDVVECIVTEMKALTGIVTTYTVSEGQDDRNSSLDSSLFMTDLDWKPMITLSETTAAIIRRKANRAEE